MRLTASCSTVEPSAARSTYQRRVGGVGVSEGTVWTMQATADSGAFVSDIHGIGARSAVSLEAIACQYRQVAFICRAASTFLQVLEQ